MKPVRAQFARPRAPSAAWWFTCVALLVACVYVAWLAQQAQRRTKEARSDVEVSERALSEVKQSALRQPQLAPAPYETSAREMLAQRSMQWPAVLAALEAVSVAGVRVLSVDLVAAEARVRVELGFATQASALEYVQALTAGVPDSGWAWRWKPIQMSQARSTNKGTATLEATWSAH